MGAGTHVHTWGSVEVTPFEDESAVEYSDGSRMEGVSAAVIRDQGRYLGEWSTIIDVEMLGIAIGWEVSPTATIQRVVTAQPQ